MRTLLTVILLATNVAVYAADWTVDHGRSRLGFTATQQGGEFQGRFREFTADMRFAPEDPAGGAFDVTIDVASVDTGSRQRDRFLPGKEWFDADTYPEAHFRASSIRRIDDDRYEAAGTLTIKGNSREIRLPFQWTQEGDTAQMKGEVAIDRTDFDVGEGEWASDDPVGRKVTVEVDLVLQRQTGS
ncbi:MAG: YceI family protein [Ectothiorhodospiraceae bacterium]|jgi:polyisoprenoid-binding protein YceI